MGFFKQTTSGNPITSFPISSWSTWLFQTQLIPKSSHNNIYKSYTVWWPLSLLPFTSSPVILQIIRNKIIRSTHWPRGSARCLHDGPVEWPRKVRPHGATVALGGRQALEQAQRHGLQHEADDLRSWRESSIGFHRLSQRCNARLQFCRVFSFFSFFLNIRRCGGRKEQPLWLSKGHNTKLLLFGCTCILQTITSLDTNDVKSNNY